MSKGYKSFNKEISVLKKDKILSAMIESKLKEIKNGSVTVVIQDNKPIQLNTQYTKML